MILCSCNALSDRDVRKTLESCPCRPSVGALFRKLGCEAKCGRCTRNIVAVLDQRPATELQECERDETDDNHLAEEMAA